MTHRQRQRRVQHQRHCQTYWSLRQNPKACTNQDQMRKFITSQLIVTCPFGHLGNQRNNVVSGIFNETDPEWSSQSQDRTFMNPDEMKIGDICVIPFCNSKRKRRDSMLVRIVSPPIYAIETGLFTIQHEDGSITLNIVGEIPFRPAGRRIEIIFENYNIPDKRILPRTSLCRINPAILPY